MDKGILYIVCTVLVLGGLFLTSKSLNNKVDATCGVKTVVKEVVVTPTVEPTATPSATLKGAVKVVTPVVTKSVVK